MNCKKCDNKLLEESLFCNKCGSRQGEYTDKKFFLKKLLTTITEKIYTNKVIFIVASIIIVSIAGILIFTSNSMLNFKSAINKNNYIEASKIYNEKIKGNIEKEGDTNNYIKSEIDNIKNDFINQKIEFNHCITRLETIQNTGLLITDVDNAITLMNRINDSRIAFKKGNEFLKVVNYKDAILEYKKVINDDNNFNSAQELINKNIKEYKTRILKSAEDSSSKGDITNASLLLSEGLEIIPNDADILSKKAVYDKANDEKKIAERKNKMEQLKVSQQIIVEKASITVQDNTYKTLYPDMIQVIVRNKTDKIVKNFIISCLAYDLNGLPIKVKTQYSYSGGVFEFTGTAEQVNIVAGGTYGSKVGFNLDETHGIKTILSCVKSAEFYDGSNWENPYYALWLEEYKEKLLH